MSKTIQRARVLVVDDERAAREGLGKLLSLDGYRVELAESGSDALAVVPEFCPDAVVTDMKMPNMGGLELLKKLRKHDPNLPVIVVTAFGDIDNAVRAMREGAVNFLAKPLDVDSLTITLQRAIAVRAVQAEADTLRAQVAEKTGGGLRGLVGSSPAMQEVYQVAKQVAPTRATVLITGDSGTGKGELARVIHEMSDRANQPFVTVHCASLADSLLESELFGHERGSFTGADRLRKGRFELAIGGTLFLDEVGEIPLSTQVKLLRVLQERVVERVGGSDPIAVDVRVMAATNRDLSEAVRNGDFREDLYYRLNVVHVDMPPLRLRGADILVLARHFLQKFARENGKTLRGFSEPARNRILSHHWPGNVRELENAIERGVVMAEGDFLEPSDLPSGVAPKGTGLRIPGSTMAEIEKYAILTTLDSCGSTRRTAEILGISIRTVQYRLRDYGLHRANNNDIAASPDPAYSRI